MAERFQIAQPLGARADGALERAAGALVQLGAAREQEVLVDDLVHERVREAVAVALAAGARRALDQIGLDEAVERAAMVRASLAIARSSASSNTAPSTAASWSRRRASAGSRSTRERSRPCSVGGTSTASQAAVHAQRSPSRTSTPLPTRLRTISSTKSGLPPARVATKSWSWSKAVAARRAEEAAHQRARLVGRERGEADDRLRGPGHERRARLGPVREQHHQRPVREMVDDVAAAGRPRPRRPSGDRRRRSAAARAPGAARPERARPARSGAGAARARRPRASRPPRRARSSAPARWPRPPRPWRRARGGPAASFCRATSSESSGSTW